MFKTKISKILSLFGLGFVAMTATIPVIVSCSNNTNNNQTSTPTPAPTKKARIYTTVLNKNRPTIEYGVGNVFDRDFLKPNRTYNTTDLFRWGGINRYDYGFTKYDEPVSVWTDENPVFTFNGSDATWDKGNHEKKIPASWTIRNMQMTNYFNGGLDPIQEPLTLDFPITFYWLDQYKDDDPETYAKPTEGFNFELYEKYKDAKLRGTYDSSLKEESL